MHLDVLALQRPLQHLDVSTPQWPELQMDVSTLERPVLLLEVSTPQHRGLSCPWTCLHLDGFPLYRALSLHVLLLDLSTVYTLQIPVLHLDVFSLQEP